MEKRKFGNKNEYLSVLGLGGIVIKGLDQYSSDSIVSDAISEGINYFDVAPGYGDAEQLLGLSLKKYRSNSFLACKTNKRTEKEATEELHNSLKILKTDYFDLYQLHAMKNDEDFDKVMADDGAMKTLQKAKEKGLVKYLGFSCHSEKVAKKLIESFEFDSILMPVNWGVYLKHGFGSELLEIAKNKGIAVLALKSMALQMWDDPKNRKYKNCWYEPIDDPYFAELALKFTLSKSVTSLLSPGDPKLFKLALKFVKNFSPITSQEMKELRDFSNKINPIGSKTEIFI
ncbi:MAG: oxidoreductase [Chloroflexi bacterium]|nr:oxidoreductase [Chloroflexota bacterium]